MIILLGDDRLLEMSTFDMTPQAGILANVDSSSRQSSLSGRISVDQSVV